MQPRVRTAAEYLAGAVGGEVGEVARTLAAGPSDWVNADGARYVLLSGCRADQTSKEVIVDGSSRGAMSLALERTLRSIGGAVSYQLLQRSVVAAVRNLAANQTPQLESPVPGDVSQPFLGGAAAPAEPLLSVSHDERRGWVLDAGLVHGIPPVTPGAEPTTLELREPGGDGAVATAAVRSAGPASSVVEPEDGTQLDPATTYRAVLRRLPVVPVTVQFGEGTGELQAALAGSALVRAVDASPADLAVSVVDGRLRLTLGGGDRPLVEDRPAEYPQPMADAVEHVARWRLIAARGNPATRLDPRALGLAVLDLAGKEIEPREGTVTCSYVGGQQPVVRVRVRNDSTQRLYYALLVLSEHYGVTSLLQGGGQWLSAGEEAFVLDDAGSPQLYLEVPGEDERANDVLKLLVSTEEFDAQGLQQDELQPPTLRAVTVEKGVSTRPQVPAAGDWATTELTLTTVRPGAAVAVGATGAATLTADVVVEPHPSFTATARLASVPTSAREISVPLVPPLLRDEPGLADPFPFAAVRAVGEELSVLELQSAQRPETVTPEQPLVLRVPRPLAEGELVLPIAFDGEDYLPVGTGRADGATTRIDITRLPASTELAERSLGGSVRILFRKLVLKRLGFGYEWPKLSLVAYEDDGTPRFDTDDGAVREAVAAADRVLLLIHGIIGDTRGMAAAVGAAPNLRGAYGAVLAFDYESINTSVPLTAEAMAEQLRAAGFAADDGRTLDVLAHSMGGLVTRWLVEQAGGAELVDKVIFCGTPHAGSPWPRVQDLAAAGVGLALNGLSGLTGPLALATQALGFAVSALERVDVALDDMKPGSEVLAKLASSSQPRVPYIAIAGDAPFGQDGDAGRAERILTKLASSTVLATLFDEGPNDLAVSVKSATTFGAAWAERPPHVGAHCNHLTYFASEPGLSAVEQALRPA